MSHRPSRFLSPLVHLGTALAASLTVACAPFGFGAPPPPAAPPGGAAPAKTLGTMTLAPEHARSVREHLSGKVVSDFQRTLISSPTRWGQPDPAPTKDGAPDMSRRLMALGAQLDPDWPSTGLNLRAAPYSIPATDRATNGMALRNAEQKYGKKIFVLTQQGRFLGLDPNNPGVGINSVTLTGTFSKTYVALSADGSTAFCINDAGVVHAVNVANPSAGVYSSRSRTLTGTPATVQTGLFMDPLATDFITGATTMYVVDNAGGSHRLTWGGTGGDEAMSTGRFASTGFTEAAVVALPATTPVTTATPISGTGIVKAPPVVLGGILIIGDRAGNVIKYDYNTATKTAWTVNYGWPIETPCPVDCDDNLNITDIFAAAGAQLFWINGATSAAPVYTGQYALVENTGNNDIVHANNFTTYVNTTADTLRADSDWEAFSSAYSTISNSLSLPLTANTPTSLDYDHLTHCGFLTGLPPTISAFCGKLNTKFYYYYPWATGGTGRPQLAAAYPVGGTSPYQVTTPVQDGECNQNANLLSPSAIEFDDDGSYFVADTNHCQVLWVPASSTSWTRWYPATAMTTTAATYNWRAGVFPNAATTLTTGRYAAGTGQPANSPPQNNFYVFAGSLYPFAPNADAEWSGRQTSDGDPASLIRDVGNGVGASVFTQPAIGANAVSRGTAVNRVQGLAIGNLGLYVANRNAFQGGGATSDEGQILFIPRVGLAAGTYFGIANPVPGRTYVISNFVDPQGLDVWRHPTNASRDIVFAPSMGGTGGNAPSRNRVCKIDSTNAAPTMAGTTIASTNGTVDDPYDVGLDDGGNLFIAEHGGDRLLMVAKAVTTAEGAPAAASVFNWGTAGTAGTLYQILTGMQEISSVTFAANDPQVPAGQRCLYIATGGNPTASIPNRISRFDRSLYHAAVAGPSYTYRNTGFVAGENLAAADAGDGGDGTAAAVRMGSPWRARGRYNSSNNTFETYICDRGNNRIRRIVSSAGTANAQGYMSMPVTAAALGKPIYTSTLSLFARNTVAGNKGIPTINTVSSRLKNGSVWSSTTVAANQNTFLPLIAPALDTVNGAAFPITPSTTGPWNIAFHATGDATLPYSAPVYSWRLPSQSIFTSATNTEFQHLRLGMGSPADGVSYFYPTSTGTISTPNEKSPDFYTNRGMGTVNNYCPRVDYRYGNRAIGPILSPPTIYYQNNTVGSTRYVYLMNANAMWRYDVTSPAAFISGTNGAQVAFSKSAQGRDAAKGNVYSFLSSFQFNSTPPLVGFNGHIYSIDIWGNTATQYTYFLNDFDGDLANTASAMYVNGVQIGATNVLTSSPTDNAGIYLAADAYITEAYFGLSDGKIYRMDLNASAP